MTQPKHVYALLCFQPSPKQIKRDMRCSALACPLEPRETSPSRLRPSMTGCAEWWSLATTCSWALRPRGCGPEPRSRRGKRQRGRVLHRSRSRCGVSSSFAGLRLRRGDASVGTASVIVLPLQLWLLDLQGQAVSVPLSLLASTCAVLASTCAMLRVA